MCASPRRFLQGGSQLTIPNLLSASRLAATPWMGYLLITDRPGLCLGVVAAASLTDGLDGYIARRFNQQSVLGTFLDPLADKAMMTTLAITMGAKGLLPVPLVGLFVGRDVALMLGALFLRYKSLPPPVSFKSLINVGSNQTMEIRPTTISKVNTALQMSLVVVALGVEGFESWAPLDIVRTGLIWATAGTTIASFVSYLRVKGYAPR